jgi:uncharacterized spore protein YtfJ
VRMSKRALSRSDRTRMLPGVRRLATRLSGAKLCFGQPVRAGENAVIPVARVRAAGGMGIGRSPDAQASQPPGDGARAQAASEGGGGGGAIDARPLGFITVGPKGAYYTAIRDPTQALRAAGVAVAATALIGMRVRAGGRILPDMRLALRAAERVAERASRSLPARPSAPQVMRRKRPLARRIRVSVAAGRRLPSPKLTLPRR